MIIRKLKQSGFVKLGDLLLDSNLRCFVSLNRGFDNLILCHLIQTRMLNCVSVRLKWFKVLFNTIVVRNLFLKFKRIVIKVLLLLCIQSDFVHRSD